MPGEDLYHDIIDRHGTVTERIRKLEIMPHGLAITPSRWRPTPDFADAIAGHVTLLGAWSDEGINYSGAGGQAAHVPAASNALHAELDAGGFGSVALAQQFTEFLYRLKAIPEPDNWQAFEPAGDPPTWLVANRPSLITADGARRLYFTGLPGTEDSIIFEDEGGQVRLGQHGTTIYSHDSGNLRLWDDSGYAVSPGALWRIPSEDPIVFRDNTYGAGHADCGGPNEPRYNDLRGGVPYVYDDGPTPCPEDPGTGIHDGGIFRAVFAFPTLDPYLAEPPRHASAEHPPTDTLAVGDGNAYPGMPWLRDGVAAILGAYPAVAGWYENALARAIAYEYQQLHYNWQSLRMFYGWGGRVEAQVRDQLVILRGRATLRADTLTNSPPVAAWPPGFPENYLGFSNHQPRFLAHDSLGRIVPHIITAADEDQGEIVPVITAPGFDRDVGWGYSISYDGVTIPVKYPWP